MLLRGLSEKGFNQSVRRTKQQKTGLQSWASAGGDKTGIPPLEMGTKKQKFLENVKSAV